MLFLFVMDDIQLRNFFACTFLYLGILVLFSNLKAKKIFFAILIIFASTIHVSFYAYLLFLIVPLNDTDAKYGIKMGLIFFCLSILFLFFRQYLSFVSNILSIVDSKRAEGYSLLSSNYGGAYFILIQSVTSVFFWRAYCQECLNPTSLYDIQNKKNISQKKILFIYMNINFIAIAYCSLVIFSITFYRLLRNLYLINIVGFYTTSIKRNNHYYWIPVIIYLVFWLFLDIFPKGHYDLYVVPIFRNNLFIEDINFW